MIRGSQDYTWHRVRCIFFVTIISLLSYFITLKTHFKMLSNFWHVCYVKPRCEKIVQRKINELNFECFLPLVNHRKVYRTSKKMLQLPLFPGYIFINIAAGYRHHVTAIPEIYKFIRFKDEYARISEEEINNIKLLVGKSRDFSEIYTDTIFQKGLYAEVIDGPFKGIKGQMIERNGKNRIYIEVQALNQSLAIDVEAQNLQILSDIECLEFVPY